MEPENIVRVKLTDVNPHLVCVLCHGYFVDATTITECLHSFCRSCIFRHLGFKSYCPICEVQVNCTKYDISLKPDKTLQDMVYKLVPGLYHNEMQRRRDFYKSHPNRDLHLHPESRGLELDRLIYSPEDKFSISIEYYDSEREQEEWTNNNNIPKTKVPSRKDDKHSSTPRRYLLCPAAFKMAHLKKFLRQKYGLRSTCNVEVIYKRESLPDSYSLMDVAYIYPSKTDGPMRFYYRLPDVLEEEAVYNKETEVSDAKNTEEEKTKPVVEKVKVEKKVLETKVPISKEKPRQQHRLILPKPLEPKSEEKEAKKENLLNANNTPPKDVLKNDVAKSQRDDVVAKCLAGRQLSKQDEMSVSALLSLGLDCKPPEKKNGIKDPSRKVTKMSVNKIASDLQIQKSKDSEKPANDDVKLDKLELSRVNSPSGGSKWVVKQTSPPKPSPLSNGAPAMQPEDKPAPLTNGVKSPPPMIPLKSATRKSPKSPKIPNGVASPAKVCNGTSPSKEPARIVQSNSNNRLPTFKNSRLKSWAQVPPVNKNNMSSLDQRIQQLYNIQAGNLKQGSSPSDKSPPSGKPPAKESRLASWLQSRFSPQIRPKPQESLTPESISGKPEPKTSSVKSPPAETPPATVPTPLPLPPLVPVNSAQPTPAPVPVPNPTPTTTPAVSTPDSQPKKESSDVAKLDKEVNMLKRKLEELRKSQDSICEITQENPDPQEAKRRRDIKPDVSIELMRASDVPKETKEKKGPKEGEVKSEDKEPKLAVEPKLAPSQEVKTTKPQEPKLAPLQEVKTTKPQEPKLAPSQEVKMTKPQEPKSTKPESEPSKAQEPTPQAIKLEEPKKVEETSKSETASEALKPPEAPPKPSVKRPVPALKAIQDIIELNKRKLDPCDSPAAKKVKLSTKKDDFNLNDPLPHPLLNPSSLHKNMLELSQLYMRPPTPDLQWLITRPLLHPPFLPPTQ